MWIKLNEATTPPRSTWLNLDQIVQMVAAPERGARLYTSTMVRSNTYKTAIDAVPEFFKIDVVENPDEIMKALHKRADDSADEQRQMAHPSPTAVYCRALQGHHPAIPDESGAIKPGPART